MLIVYNVPNPPKDGNAINIDIFYLSIVCTRKLQSEPVINLLASNSEQIIMNQDTK